MKILMWNARGLGGTSNNAPAQFDLVELVKKLEVSLFSVLESKFSSTRIDDFLSFRFPSWESCSNFDAIENGRIFVVWDVCRVACDILEIGCQHIHMKVLCKEMQQSFLTTFVYPLYDVVKRRECGNTFPHGDR
ncbi:hypothetical protein LIER_43665 [Lithospermum erythrorhizon]|uniref:Uncharacterized protein n=1 Tax=Lithospermum erythrorhizon TaxID=34254 RepID=A0AAV3QMG3_LITER